MGIATQITVSVKPELANSVLNTSALKPGNTLRLKILDLRGDRALIDFGNFRATADVKVPVTRGDELRVRIMESGKQLKMSVISLEQKHPAATDVIPARLADPGGPGLDKVQTELKQIISQVLGSHAAKSIPESNLNIFRRLNTYFEPIDLKIMAELGPRLKSYLENSGIFFEKSLENRIINSPGSPEPLSPKQMADLPEVKHILERDLKANLLALRSLMTDKEALQKFLTPKSLNTLINSISSLLSDITQQQDKAVGQLDSGESLQVFSYSLPLKDGKQAARLKLYYQNKQKSGADKGFRISLLLSMDRLGDLRTDFYLLDKDLTITFFVKEDSAKVLIQQNFPKLQELLHDLFNQTLLKVVVSKKKVADFDREDIRVTSNRQVDLRI